MHVFKRSWRWACWASFSSLAFWISSSCSMPSLHADACGSGILNYFSSAWEKKWTRSSELWSLEKSECILVLRNLWTGKTYEPTNRQPTKPTKPTKPMNRQKLSLSLS
jgi:hypothetical protein